MSTQSEIPSLEIIHENNDFIVVNKQAGHISEKSPYEEITTESLLLKHLLVSKRKPYIGVIHRLDRVTSGVLLFAKKKNILVAFNQLFSERKIQKTYLAIVHNEPPKSSGELLNYLVKNNLEKGADVEQSPSKEAKESILTYKVIGKNNFGYLLEVKPKTGRFHQIRVQLANIGLPIIGDLKYGSEHEYQNLSICLHARKITYLIPGTKESKTWVAPLPKNEFWEFDTTDYR